MRINTAESIKTGKTVRERFGSWEAAKKAARYKDGKYTVSSDSAKSGKGGKGDNGSRRT